MNRLYLLRHGVAVPHGTPGIEDDQRRTGDQVALHRASTAKTRE